MDSPCTDFIQPFPIDNLSTDLCPKCQILCLTKPKASTGHYTPENNGRMYQQVIILDLLTFCTHYDSFYSVPTIRIRNPGSVMAFSGVMICSALLHRNHNFHVLAPDVNDDLNPNRFIKGVSTIFALSAVSSHL